MWVTLISFFTFRDSFKPLRIIPKIIFAEFMLLTSGNHLTYDSYYCEEGGFIPSQVSKSKL
jgi:hypothetical protein